MNSVHIVILFSSEMDLQPAVRYEERPSASPATNVSMIAHERLEQQWLTVCLACLRKQEDLRTSWARRFPASAIPGSQNRFALSSACM